MRKKKIVYSAAAIMGSSLLLSCVLAAPAFVRAEGSEAEVTEKNAVMDSYIPASWTPVPLDETVTAADVERMLFGGEGEEAQDTWDNVPDFSGINNIYYPIGDTAGSGYLETYLPPVRNQNPAGSCWAHGTVAAVEFYLLKNNLADTSINLSEFHLGHFIHTATGEKAKNPLRTLLSATGHDQSGDYSLTNYNDEYERIGNENPIAAFEYLSQGNGLMPESYALYPGSTAQGYKDDDGKAYINNFNWSDKQEYVDVNDPQMDGSVRVTDWFSIDLNNNRDLAKAWIRDHGAITICYDSTDEAWYKAYNDEHNTFNTERTNGNHQVTIVGYHDGIPKSYFNNNASQNGAWLIRNSWGRYDENTFSICKYFWMSYDSVIMDDNSGQAAVAEYYTEETPKWQYRYDAGVHNAYGSGYSTVANVFEAGGIESDCEDIKEVSFVYVRDGSMSGAGEAKISIYRLGKDDEPDEGVPASVITRSMPFSGRYTIDLESEVRLEKGERFSVVAEVTGGSIAYETDWTHGDQFRFYVGSNEGEGFYKEANGEWYDYSKRYSNFAPSLLLGANTNNADTARTSISTAEVSLSADEINFNGSESKPGVTVKLSGKVLTEGLDYRTEYKNNKAPGTATVVIYGAGVYKDSVSREFTINEPGTDEWDGTVSEKFSIGDGSPSNPYMIYSAEDLALVAEYYNGGASYGTSGVSFSLQADLDLKSRPWTPIGTSARPFNGNFAGNGHSIAGLYIDDQGSDNIGFFGCMYGGVVTDLKLNDVHVNAGDHTGALCGYATDSRITGCEINYGSVKGTGYAGGLAGTMSNVYLNSCVNAADVEVSTNGVAYAGGIAGRMSSMMGSACVNFGSVSAGSSSNSAYAGGIVGYGDRQRNSVNYGNISASGGAADAGGIAGYIYQDIVNCGNLGNITARSLSGSTYNEVAGGMAGYFAAAASDDNFIYNCYNTGEIAGASSGQMVGSAISGYIGYCYAVGENMYGSISSIGTPTSVYDCVTMTYWDMQESTFKDVLNTRERGTFDEWYSQMGVYGGLPYFEFYAKAVIPGVVTGISVAVLPDKTEYDEGDSFDGAGMVLLASYDDGTSGRYTGAWTFSPEIFSGSDTGVTIYCGDFSTLIPITMTSAEPVITPEYTVYTEGGSLPVGVSVKYKKYAIYSGTKIKPSDLGAKLDITSLYNAVTIRKPESGFTAENLFSTAYATKNNKAASETKPYFYYKVSFKTPRAKKAGMTAGEIKSMKLAVNSINKYMKNHKCRYRIDPLDVTAEGVTVNIRVNLNRDRSLKETSTGKLSGIKKVTVTTPAGVTLKLAKKQYTIDVIDSKTREIKYTGKGNFTGGFSGFITPDP